MNCIYCEEDKPLVESHVISNFIRMKLTGIVGQNSTKKFRFRMLGHKIYLTQDLPKPQLLCKECDNGFGTHIERMASRVMLPNGDISSPQAWNTLPLNMRSLPFEIAGLPLIVGSYQLRDFEDDCALQKFAVLTAWRALHAMARDGNEEVREFLESDGGRRVNSTTIQFLKQANSNDYFIYPYLPTLHFLGPTSAANISGVDDEVPFAWAFLKSDKQNCMAVMLGYWVIIWPLLPDDDSGRNFHELLELTYIDWHAFVVQQFRMNQEPL